MRLAARTTLLALLCLCTLVSAGAARADVVQDLDDRLQAVTNGLVEAAIRIGEQDQPASEAAYDQAVADANVAEGLAVQEATSDLLGKKARSVRRKVSKLSARLEAKREKVYDPERTPVRVVKLLRSLARSAGKVERPLRGDGVLGFGFYEPKRAASGFHKAGKTVTFRYRPGTKLDGDPCDEAPVIVVESASNDPVPAPHVAGHADLGNGKFRVTLGEDVGGVRVSVSACGVTRERLLYNFGPKDVLDVDRVASVSYGNVPASIRGGHDIDELVPTFGTGAPDSFSVAPALPAGLVLDPVTGSISGSAAADARSASYTVTARNVRGSTSTTLTFEVTPALPAGVVELADGFVIEPFLQGLAVPAKMALAPDGRLFYTELLDGNIRVVRADGTLVAQPFGSVQVVIGGEKGLLGIALPPDFETSGHVFVYGTVPAAGQQPIRNQIVRFTAVGDTGTNPTVIVDDIPAGDLSNAGGLAFGQDGMLYVTVGDTGDEALSQTDGSLAGRVLRFTPTGGIPADNPIANDPEWVRGLRNSFDLTFHPTTGGLFITENGPTAHDELNFIQKGKNFEWGAAPDSVPGFQAGAMLRDWTPVIVPTGLVFHSGTGFGAAYEDNLFVCGYDEADIRRMPMSGPAFTDIDAEIDFARFDNDGGVANKPLDILELPDGSLVVSTFSAIWRIFRY